MAERDSYVADDTGTEAWTAPDFVEYETPFEVTAYAGRMEDERGGKSPR
jgi:coenzyme PQQ precursor peptide PqqA